MENLKYDNLSEQSGFSFPESKTTLEQQLSVLAYLHGMDVTHRYIIPENLVESRAPRLVTKLCDFGVSSNRKLLDTFCGTALYSAPEIGIDRQEYTNNVDIWSLGTVGLKIAYGLPSSLEKESFNGTKLAVKDHAQRQSGTLAIL